MNAGSRKRFFSTIALIIIVAVSAFMLNLLWVPSRVNAGTDIPAPGAVTGDGTHYLGCNPSDLSGRHQLVVPRSALPLASSVDLSGQLPPVGDQGAQGSCTAWSTSYYYKTWSEKQEHTSWNLNNPNYEYSPSFVYNQTNGGEDNGLSFSDAFSFLQNTGDVDIAEMPYDVNNYIRQPTAAQLEAAKPYRIPGDWQYFWARDWYYGEFDPPNDISAVKTWLNSGKMLVMSIPVFSDFPDFHGNPPSPYYYGNYIFGFAGRHGVCICGYDDNANPGGADADNRGGFKMVNSWGPGWNGASHGFLYLSYDFVKKFVIEAWAMNDLSPDAPSISNLSQGSGKSGDTIHIYGNNFGTLRRNAKVVFNGINATELSFTNNDITVKVPQTATSGSLAVLDWEGNRSNWVPFTVITNPTVTYIGPKSAGNTGIVQIIRIKGSHFQQGATVKLKMNGQPDITATGVPVVSPNEITSCSFDLTNVSPGYWDVVVANPDGGIGTLPGGFQVLKAGDPFPPCGQGSLGSVGGFGLFMGLLSVAGSMGLRKRLLERLRRRRVS